MLGALRRRMAAKVFLAMGLLVGGALLFQAWSSAQRNAEQLEAETQSSAEHLARLTVGAIEHTMLEGDGIKVKSLVADLKSRVPGASVRIYDPHGVEVFAAAPAPPQSVPDDLQRAMSRVEIVHSGDVTIRPLHNDESCEACHREHDQKARFPKVRGALSYRFNPTVCGQRPGEITASLVEEGFIHAMTAKQSGLLDEYFQALVSGSDSLSDIAVYDADGDLAFGSGPDALPPELLSSALAEKSAQVHVEDGAQLHMLPLRMTDRCVACHDEAPGALRGLMMLRIEQPKQPGTCPADQVEHVIVTSLRTIMLSQLGRRIADFLRATAATGVVSELKLTDNQGRVWWSTTPPPPPPEVTQVLSSHAPVVEFQSVPERVVVIEPLPNEPGCSRCHGSQMKIRGAVSVSLSTAEAAAQRAAQMRKSFWLTGSTLAGLLVILLAILQFLVVRPVNEIGDVADEVGRGNLRAEVARANPRGDEVERLGSRINEMVQGLRAKTHLEKFVSRGTAAAAHEADLDGLDRTGVVRKVTVLFSDIRGFTAYSEDRKPEEVVAMLNRLLRIQAEIVGSYGGDIDKFVGDELMAVFEGPDAERHAVHCAAELVDAVDATSVSGLRIGVGVHCGEVVYGAIGHEDRMDFTVIGDVVNTGARLCSAAKPGQVLISSSLRGACDEELVEVTEVESMPLKGKKQPLALFQVRRRHPA